MALSVVHHAIDGFGRGLFRRVRRSVYPLDPVARHAICAFLAVGSCYGAESPSHAFIDLSLEELGNVQVTSVSKKEERLADAAASIYVVTDDAIRRAGVRSLPEALRLAPNLQVAQISANQYAISARGFNSSTANKLLVMVDGRTVYTPLYSGVFWDAQDVLLQDVERIEVISGPGGTLWGANAVNGVINIITKEATDTTGNLVHATGGNSGSGVAFRHGGVLDGNSGAYRVYGKSDRGRHSIRANGAAVPDAWERSQIGFRTDLRAADGDVTVQGDLYRGSTDQALPAQQKASGANLLARWSKLLADGSQLRVQTYWDHTSREMPGTINEKLDTLDLDIQQVMPEAGGGQLIWGGGLRMSDDRVENLGLLSFLPAHRQLRWANLFAQQEWTLQPDLRLIAGGKLESNSYSGVDFLPNLKLAWKPSADQLLWAGLSRAVRAPSRIDSDLYVLGTPPLALAGGPDFRSEIANTLELGLRSRHGPALSYALVVFRSTYDYLRSLDVLPSGVFVVGNQIKGRMDGLEASASYQASKSWSLEASAVLLHGRFSGPNLALSSPGNDPRAQWRLGSTWNLGDSQQLNVSLRHVGKLPSPLVPAYTAVDARYGWRVSKSVELAVTGRNLFDRRHQEFATSSTQPNPVQVERAIDIALTVRF